MNQAIANIIKGYIEELSFIDKIAGLTSVQYINIPDENGVQVKKAYPVACCVTADDCKSGAYNDLVPDSKYRTILYFEDGGVTFEKAEGVFQWYVSRLRLIGWVNVARLNADGCYTDSPCTASTNIIIEILRNIPEWPHSHTPFEQVLTQVVSQQVRSNAIFSKYTYNELQAQYLMAPYDYFALDLVTRFAICTTSRDTYEPSCV